MHRLERRVSGGLIVFDLERFSRQPKDGERMIELAANGLVVPDSESEYDLGTANGKKAFRDAINAAAYYSDRLSTRSARGKKLKAMAGVPNGSARPFGFEADLISVREDEAAVLRDLTGRFLAGESQDALIAERNHLGRRAPAWRANVSGEDFDAVVAKYTARRRGRPNSWHYLCSGIAM